MTTPVTSLNNPAKAEKRAALMRSRHRAEDRFRLYGIASLIVSVVFLVLLLSNIVFTGWPAFWANSVKLNVNFAAEQIDPEGKRSRDALAAADYMALARSALAEAVPGVEGRGPRKDLASLLSTGAGDTLRDTVLADPNVIGKTVPVTLLLSDDADLFVKGIGTKIARSTDTRGVANPNATSGEITLLTSANDFAGQLHVIKMDLAANASKLMHDVEGLERRHGEGAKERIAELKEQAAALQKRYEVPSSEEALDGTVPSVLVAVNGGLIKATKLSPSSITGETLLPLKSTDAANPGTWQILTYETPENSRAVSDRKVAFLDKLKSEGHIESHFNWLFFTAGDSREPELAGIRGAVVGSVLTLLVTLGLCLPIGVLAAIYLEEFAPKNRLTDFIEININNLAAVPSIVFGLLGLAVFLNFFGMPRSAPVVGGLVLALLVLPTIIISARAALKAVPPSIREGALGIGASKQQAIFHHVLPMALPGIMTGSIIGMAHALGETAPLLMIGMVAFIVDVPHSLADAATVMPVQIYLWSDLPEPAFQFKTAAAIMVLLVILFLMNGTAIWLRKKFERRW